MPRLTRSLPAYRLHKSTGQAVVSIGGRDFYIGKFGSKASRSEYDRIVAEWLASGRSPTFRQPDVTVGEVLLSFFTHAKTYYGESLKGSNANLLTAARPLRRLYADLPVSEFGPQQFKAVRQSFIDAGRTRKSINRTMQRVVQIFRWAAGDAGMIPESIPRTLAMVGGLRAGKTDAIEKAPVGPVDECAVDATILKLPKIVADMVRLQRVTGMRPAEVCGVRPCDVDRESVVWSYRPALHKNSHRGLDRVVFLGPRAQAIILPYLSRDESRPCFSPAESERDRKSISQNASGLHPVGSDDTCAVAGGKRSRRPGQRYTVASYRRAIQRAAKSANVPSWSPNQLRHSTATEIRRRFGIEAAQVVLGHASANTTEIYAERNASLAAKIMAEIG